VGLPAVTEGTDVTATFPVAVLGEALVDLMPTGSGAAYLARPGGSPWNVAIGLARLGHDVRIVTPLGHDAFGGLLRRHARVSGLDLSACPEVDAPTTLAAVSMAENGEASYEFYLDGTTLQRWESVAPPGGRTAIVHFGSLGSWTEPAASRVAAIVGRLRAEGALVSYDPNVRPRLLADLAWARGLVEAAVALAHLVKASVSDLDWLYGGAERTEVARRWLELGARLVIVTDGERGASALAPGRPWVHQDAVVTDVVDTVGAGDAFTAGLLGALVDAGRTGPLDLADLGTDLDAILRHASLVAAMTCERTGAEPPTAAQVLERLAETR
jgi:fructokinase